MGYDFALVSNWKPEWDKPAIKQTLLTCYICKKLLEDPCMCKRC